MTPDEIRQRIAVSFAAEYYHQMRDLSGTARQVAEGRLLAAVEKFHAEAEGICGNCFTTLPRAELRIPEDPNSTVTAAGMLVCRDERACDARYGAA
jgi:hypothetical protein